MENAVCAEVPHSAPAQLVRNFPATASTAQDQIRGGYIPDIYTGLEVSVGGTGCDKAYVERGGAAYADSLHGIRDGAEEAERMYRFVVGLVGASVHHRKRYISGF